MYITKSDGRKERFTKDKIYNTCIRIKLGKNDATKVCSEVTKNIREGKATTQQIHKLILRQLKKRHPRHHVLYRLRQAVAEIEAHLFEQYVAQVLAEHGFTCQTNTLVRGKFVEHEVDVIAEKEHDLFLIECKHHHNWHRIGGLGKVLQLQARLEAVHDGYYEKRNRFLFTQAWLINNTKFSLHAKKYAEGKHVKLSGWNAGGEDSLNRLIEAKHAYPFTLLSADQHVKSKLAREKLLTFTEILRRKDKVKQLLPKATYLNIMKQISVVLGEAMPQE